MYRYVKSFTDTTEEYRGYFIDTYLNDDDEYEYVVDIDLAGDGDEHTFSSFSEAKEFINDLYLAEDVSRKLGY